MNIERWREELLKIATAVITSDEFSKAANLTKWTKQQAVSEAFTIAQMMIEEANRRVDEIFEAGEKMRASVMRRLSDTPREVSEQAYKSL